MFTRYLLCWLLLLDYFDAVVRLGSVGAVRPCQMRTLTAWCDCWRLLKPQNTRLRLLFVQTLTESADAPIAKMLSRIMDSLNVRKAPEAVRTPTVLPTDGKAAAPARAKIAFLATDTMVARVPLGCIASSRRV